MFFEVTAPIGALGVGSGAVPDGTLVAFERSAAALGGASDTVVVDGDAERVARGFRNSEFVDSFDRLGATGGETVYSLGWSDRVPAAVRQVRDTDCAVLSATGTDAGWSFELRLPSDDAASRFYGDYDDSDSPLTLRHTSAFGLSGQAEREALTPKQEATLTAALAAGYFDVPRGATLAEVAAEVGVSDTATSQRLRRGMANLLRGSPVLARRPERAPADD